MTPRSIAGRARRAVPGVAAVILVTLATGCSAGCSASVSIGHEKKGGTYKEHGISLKVPDGWKRDSKVSYTTKTGNEIRSEGFAPAAGENVVSVTAYSTKIAVTQKNAEAYAPHVTAVMKNLFAAGGVTMLGDPVVTSLTGLAGYRSEITFPSSSSSATLDSRLLLLWNGHTEYYFTCQFEKNGSRSAEIKRGCSTIENSFKLD